MSLLRRGDQPMECATVGKLLQQYLDGELDAVRARRLAEHLDVCGHCGLDADAYAELKRALAHSVAVSPTTVQRLLAFGRSLLHQDHDAPGTAPD